VELAIERTQLGTKLEELLKITGGCAGLYVYNKATYGGTSLYCAYADSGSSLEKKLQSHEFGCRLLALPVFRISHETGPATLTNGSIVQGKTHIMFAVDIKDFPAKEEKDA